MTLKRNLNNQEDNIPPENTANPEKSTGFNYEQEQQKIQKALAEMPPSTVDALETDNAVQLSNEVNNSDDDKGPAFPDPEEVITKDVMQSRDMSLHPPEFYEKQNDFVPAIEVSKGHDGFSDRETEEQLKKLSSPKKRTAKPASEIDLEHLDESMIIDMPEIKAASFKIVDMLDPKPKDKTLRFRWANCKNYVAGNLGKYLAMGFQVAHIDDVDQKRTPIDPSMIDGTEVKYYDVVLLKINVIRLMELYKTNIIKSVSKLVRAKEKGLAEATRQFKSDITDSGNANAYNYAKAKLGGKEPVEFYAVE